MLDEINGSHNVRPAPLNHLKNTFKILILKNTIQFTLDTKKEKYLGIHLTKYVQDLDEENLKNVMKLKN